jgi:ankyrin repeat protein
MHNPTPTILQLLCLLTLITGAAATAHINAQDISLPVFQPTSKTPNPCEPHRYVGPALYETDRQPYSQPLIEAAYQAHLSEVKRLINAGVDVNTQTERNETALWFAVSAYNLEMASFLTEAGANPNLAAVYGGTPLVGAARSKCYELTKLLISSNADVNLKTRDGRTAIMEAAEAGNLEVVKLLAAAGADINIGANEDRSTMFVAIKTGDLELVRFLFSLDKGRDRPRTLDIGLYLAIASGKTEMVRFLLDQGATAKTDSKKWGNPLCTAAQVKNLDTVKLLLEFGGDPNGPGPERLAVITCAAIGGNVDIVRILIAAGATVNPKKQNWSPLHEAARHDNVPLAKLLLKAGADINARAYDGWTVLMMAVSCCAARPGVVRLLIDSGVNLNLRDDDDEKISALHIARLIGHKDVIDMLVEAGAVD